MKHLAIPTCQLRGSKFVGQSAMQDYWSRLQRDSLSAVKPTKREATIRMWLIPGNIAASIATSFIDLTRRVETWKERRRYYKGGRKERADVCACIEGSCTEQEGNKRDEARLRFRVLRARWWRVSRSQTQKPLNATNRFGRPVKRSVSAWARVHNAYRLVETRRVAKLRSLLFVTNWKGLRVASPLTRVSLKTKEKSMSLDDFVIAESLRIASIVSLGTIKKRENEKRGGQRNDKEEID